MVAHNRVIISGKLGSQEVWSTSFAMGSSDGNLLVEQADLLTAAETFWAYMDSETNTLPLQEGLSSSGEINAITVQARATDGTLVDQAVYTDSPIIGNLTQTKPYQTALVITLRTASPSRNRRGRMYWPMLTGTLIAGRLGTDPTPTEIAVSASNMLEAASSIFTVLSTVGDIRASVYSPTEGFVTPVTSVSVGDVLDTQRRRRDNLLENYVSVAVV